MMTQPKCHAAAAQRMSVAESLGGEWTQKPASSDEAELIQGLPRSTKQCQGESGKTSPDDANHSGLTTIRRLKVWLCIPNDIFYT